LLDRARRGANRDQCADDEAFRALDRLINFKCPRPPTTQRILGQQLPLNIMFHKLSNVVIYRIDEDASVIAEVFAKKTPQTPSAVIKTCQKRLKEYDNA
jgi:hypothetical protein